MSRAIELLETIISNCDEVRKGHPFPDEPLIYNRPCHRCSSKNDCYVIDAIEALTELQKQAAAGDFTKELMADANHLKDLGQAGALFGRLSKACVIIDQQAKEIVDLHREYQDLAAINLKIQADVAQLEVYLNDARNDNAKFQAEIERLKERIEELEVETSI